MATVRIVHARWVSATAEARGQYVYPSETITYPDDCVVSFDANQGAVIIRRPSGEPVAAFRGLSRFHRPDDVTVTDDGEGT